MDYFNTHLITNSFDESLESLYDEAEELNLDKIYKLFAEICPQKEYDLPRCLKAYSYIVLNQNKDEIDSIQFFEKKIDTKTNISYFYFGPAVSRKNYFFLLLTTIKKILNASNLPTYIIAELQNPILYEKLKEIFPTNSTPKDVRSITSDENKWLNEVYNLFPDLLDPRPQNSWISYNQSKESYCKNSATAINEQVLFALKFIKTKSENINILNDSLHRCFGTTTQIPVKSKIIVYHTKLNRYVGL